jgi:hypothetical protein
VEAVTVVVVTGPPASGKTTLARAITGSLGWPLYTKDDIKELLFETVGTGDLEWSARLGAAAMELLGFVLRTSAEPLVLEANFRCLETERRVVQVFCTDTAEALNARYRARGGRHPGHLDDQRVIDPSEYAPLPLGGELIEYSVGSRSVDDVVAAVRRALGLG